MLKRMPTKVISGKNALWVAYKEAAPLIRDEIKLELKKVDLFRHWRDVASKEDYDLKNAKALLRDAFLKVMPETAPFFGLPALKQAHRRKEKPTDGTLALFN